MKPRAVLLPLLVILTALILASPLLAFPHTTLRISINSTGEQANGASRYSSMSTDGRFVAFASDASNLVADDANGVADVFVYDTTTAAIERVSVGAVGVEGNGAADSPDISADGRFVVFQSRASNLVSGDSNNLIDIFVHDRTTKGTTRVSVSSTGAQALQGHSTLPSISADGQVVAFQSLATNLAPTDTLGVEDIFVHNRTTGTTTHIAPGTMASLSGDGTLVVFGSTQSNLVEDDTNQVRDIFVHHLPSRVTQRVSVNTAGDNADGESRNPTISANGRYVAFESAALNLVPNDTNGPAVDVFVYDQQLEVTTRISSDTSSGTIINTAGWISLSNDGQRVAFESARQDLVSGDTNNMTDIFLYDMQTATIKRISQGFMDEQSNGNSAWPSISGNGFFVAFHSTASNLAPIDSNGVADPFITNVQPILPQVALSSFTTTQDEANIIVRWEVASETSVRGYNIYRGSITAPEERLNTSLIPKQNLRTTTTRIYEWTDTAPTSNGRYWLEVVGELAASEWIQPSGTLYLYLPVMRQ